MSDNYIHIIPAEPGVVPGDDRQRAAVSYFRQIAPKADEVRVSVSENLEFVHCGANFEKICCPACGARLSLVVWQEWMDDDVGEKGFTLVPHTMPCCGAQRTLHELPYEWPQGFARCDVYAMNPNIGKLSDEQRTRFESILDCPCGSFTSTSDAMANRITGSNPTMRVT